MSTYGPLFALAIVVVVAYIAIRHDRRHLAERNKSCDKTPAKRRPRRAF